MTRICGDKATDQLIKRAIGIGGSWCFTGGGHIKITAPTGAIVFTPASPSDPCRNMKNLRGHLRRAWEGWSVL